MSSCRATLRVFSARFTADEITAALGLPATETHARGEPVSARRPDGPRRDQHVWLLESGVDEEAPFEDHVAALVALAEARRTALAALAHDGAVDLRGAFSSESGQAGFTLAPSLLRRLAALDLALIVDLFPPEE